MDNLPVAEIEAQGKRAKATYIKERYEGRSGSEPKVMEAKKTTDRGDETNIANAYKNPHG